MKGYVIFTAGVNAYALEIERVERIMQARSVTEVPNAHPLVEGMVSYQGQIEYVANFRRMIGLPSYEEELETQFASLRGLHLHWLDDLTQSVSEGTAFKGERNPHACELGAWLNRFNYHDERLGAILRRLNADHKRFHAAADAVAAMQTHAALEYLQTEVTAIYERMMESIGLFVESLESVATSLQKFLIIRGDEPFMLQVDDIKDIVYREEAAIQTKEAFSDGDTAFVEVGGVFEHDQSLVNVIKSVLIPTSEVA